MKEEKAKKRGWVKNAAIIFLAALAVLTFFSNSIMNRSLPEVAVQYTSSGTITPRVRRTVAIEANENYELFVDQTRTVLETHARRDREVSAGDVLLILSEADSDEIEALRIELDAAREDLQRQLLEYEIAVLTAGKGGGFVHEERSIRDARGQLDLAEEALEEIPYSEAKIEDARYGIVLAENSVSAAKARVDLAKSRVDSAKAAVGDAKAARQKAQDSLDAREKELRNAENYRDELVRTPSDSEQIGDFQRRLQELNSAISNKNVQITVAKNQHAGNYEWFEKDSSIFAAEIDPGADPADWDDPSISDPDEWDAAWEAARKAYWNSLSAQVRNASMSAFAATLPADDPRRVAFDSIRELNEELTALTAERDEQNRGISSEQDRDNTAEYDRRARRAADAAASRDRAASELENTNRALAAAEEALAENEAAVNVAETAVGEAEKAVGEAEMKLEAEEKHKSDWRAAGLEVVGLQIALEDLLYDLDDTQRDAGIDDAVAALNMSEARRQLGRKRDEIGRMQDEIDSLEVESISATVTSPVNGIVKDIVSAGSKTEPGRPAVVIEVPDRGYAISFTVSLDESKLVAVGDIAEVNRGWWGGGNVHAEVTAIRNDPQNPVASRIVELDVSGEVQSGEQLTLTLGQRGQQYDLVVPNSALRTDTNGDFVLIVLAKPSPLGNRYVATRADVRILAQDDTYAAVSGDLSGWDYVITTSTKPIEPGMQVRLADNM